MKQLKSEEMSSINGGYGFWDGVCAAVAVARVFAVPLAFTPVGVLALGTGAAVCIVAKLGNFF
jgi:hypothetical protein